MVKQYFSTDIICSLCKKAGAFLVTNEGNICAACNKKRLIEEGILKG